jgi:hypothetical protein
MHYFFPFSRSQSISFTRAEGIDISLFPPRPRPPPVFIHVLPASLFARVPFATLRVPLRFSHQALPFVREPQSGSDMPRRESWGQESTTSDGGTSIRTASSVRGLFYAMSLSGANLDEAVRSPSGMMKSPSGVGRSPPGVMKSPSGSSAGRPTSGEVAHRRLVGTLVRRRTYICWCTEVFEKNTTHQIDLLSLPSDAGYAELVVVVDLATRMIGAEPMKYRSSATVLHVFSPSSMCPYVARVFHPAPLCLRSSP